jgi:hypothetical protein
MPVYEDFFRQSIQQLRDFRLHLPNAAFGNPPWGESPFHALVVRLSPFSDVQRSTPHLFLTREVRASLPAAYVDVAFLPCEQDARTLEEAGLPLLLGTQSHRSLSDFDLALVSNSWVLEQANLPYLLERSRVPLWASERGDQWPPLIVGGSNSLAAHALVSASGDCMADALFFGEGEGLVRTIISACMENSGAPKRERLAKAAARVTGLWLAGDLGAKVRKASCTETDNAEEMLPAPILPGPEAGTARLSVTQGCPCLCSFCFEGHERKPFREIPAARLLAAARALKVVTGADTLEIDSFNFNTHSEIAQLLIELNRIFHRVNLMSQRVDILARTPGLLELEIAADKRSFTLGIEGISEASRRFLHKSLSEKEIHSALEALHGQRTRELKLFFLLTGREEAADFQELAQLVKWLKRVRERAVAPPRMVFSFGMLVRMPFTPLRHDPLVLDETVWRQLSGKAKSICETNGFEFRLAMAWPEYAATQLLAAGGHEMHGLLQSLARQGAVTERLAHGAAAEVNQALSAFGAAREKPLGHPFAFAFLDDAETRQFLHQQYMEAKAGRDSGYCRRGSSGAADCAQCPGCTRVPPRSAGGDVKLANATGVLRSLMERKHKLKPLFVVARLPRQAAGLGAKWAEAWLMRKLFEEQPAQTDNVVALQEVLLDGANLLGDEVPWFGTTIAAVTAWDAKALEESLGKPGSSFAGPAPGFAPGLFHDIQVRVSLPRDLFPDAPARLAAFMKDSHAPVTLTRKGTAVTLVVGEKSLRKRSLLAATFQEATDTCRCELSIGPKAFLGDWLSSFGGGRETARRAMVEIVEVRL